MANIPRSSIKKMMKEFFNVNITDDGAEEMARILESKAREISRYAVESARKADRGKVTKEDIVGYVIGNSDGR